MLHGGGGLAVLTSPDATYMFNDAARFAALSDDYQSDQENNLNEELFSVSNTPFNGANITSVSYVHMGDGDHPDFFTGIQYFNGGNLQAAQFNETVGRGGQAFVGLSWMLGNKFSMSGLIRTVEGDTHGYLTSGAGVSADISVFFDGRNEYGIGLTAASTLSNFGPAMGYESPAMKGIEEHFPMTWGTGIAYTFDPLMNYNRVILSADVFEPLYPSQPQNAQESAQYQAMNWFGSVDLNRPTICAGVEYDFKPHGKGPVTYTAGFGLIAVNMLNPDYSGVTVGGGLKYRGVMVNLAYFKNFDTYNLPYGNRSFTLSISTALKH